MVNILWNSDNLMITMSTLNNNFVGLDDYLSQPSIAGWLKWYIIVMQIHDETNVYEQSKDGKQHTLANYENTDAADIDWCIYTILVVHTQDDNYYWTLR